MSTGARRSQLCGLQWRDAELSSGGLTFARVVVDGPDGIVVKGTKTNRTYRVTIDGSTLAVLQAHHDRMKERADFCGVALRRDGYVFSHAPDAAAPWRPDVTSHRWRRARGGGVGHLAMLDEDRVVLARGDMEAQVTIAMAGIAAEELLVGEPSTGSEEDLKRATNTARDMAGRFGMSPRLGRVRVLHDHGEVFLGRDYLASQDVSQPTLEHLDAEVRRILDEQEAAAHSILADNRDILERLVAVLVRDETVRGPDLAALVAGIRPPARTTRGSNGNGTATSTRSRAGAAPARPRRTRGNEPPA